MADKLANWMKAGKHLPEVMRDFHDQKDLFKAMHDMQRPVDGSSPSPADAVDFMTGQCYVIDRFLWFMARRGYTLQRSRAQLPFLDLQADVKVATERRNEQLSALLTAHVSSVRTSDRPFPDPDCKTCGGTGVDPGGLPVCRDCYPYSTKKSPE